MATKKSSSSTFYVMGKLKGTVSVIVQATDLENALEQARKLEFVDFVAPQGEVMDYDQVEITSVYTAD